MLLEVIAHRAQKRRARIACLGSNVSVDCSKPREYDLHKIPAEQGLVKVLEGGETLASEDLMEVVNSERLTGIEFKEFGVYV